MGSAHLDEADVLGVLTEALSADVEAVLADQTPVIGAHTAAGIHRTTLPRKISGQTILSICPSFPKQYDKHQWLLLVMLLYFRLDLLSFSYVMGLLQCAPLIK